MAEMNDEAAFLASMGGEEYTPHYTQPDADEENEEDEEEDEEDDDDEDEEDYDPSSFLPDNNDAPVSATPQPTKAVETAPSQSVPDSATLLQPSQSTPHAPSRTSSRTSNTQSDTQKPVTIGGFIEEDDEEEGDSPQEPHTMGTSGDVAVASAKSPSQAHPGSIIHTPVPASVHVYNPPQTTGESDVVPNGSAESVSNLPVSLSLDGTAEGKSAENAEPQSNKASQSNTSSLPTTTLPKARLPHDIVGQYEDRIKNDPKGDVEAWLGLLTHLRSKSKYDEVRKLYARFFEVFPTTSDQWLSYAQMEQQNDELPRMETVFQQSLIKCQSVALWSMYLDHVRRRNDGIDEGGRKIVSQAYDFVLGQVGIDKDSGQIWRDFIGFVKSGPGSVGGSGWQDAQKMDLLRKAYQRAICVPMGAVESLWKEYSSFEMELNRMTGRKFLTEKSPACMTARSSYTQLQNMIRDLSRGGIPKLPPLPGCDGHDHFMAQVEIWQKWITWEKDDPVVLKDEDVAAYRQRILYAYKQATMALRFWPQLWYDAAEFCFGNGLDTEGNDFLTQSIAANPESCLLALKRADRIEQTFQAEEGDEGSKRRGDAVREPYNTVLDAIYSLGDKIKEREPVEIAQVEESFAAMTPDSREATPEVNADDDDEDTDVSKPLSLKARKEKQIAEVRAANKEQMKLLSKTGTFVWIALMRSMRRIQGKGKPGDKLGGMRQVFVDARKRGRLTSDLYLASAMMEHHCYHDPAATKILERALKLFPEDEGFVLEYMKFLVGAGDVTNARAVFETTVSKIASKPENVAKTRALYYYFHQWESSYGELAQVSKLEKRIADLFPEDKPFGIFIQRYATSHVEAPVFDPCTVRLIVSPTQTRVRSLVSVAVPTIEAVAQPAVVQTTYTQSPKRPYDDSDAEQPARKFLRGESPLKGAAGRRQQQRQAREAYGTHLAPAMAPPNPLPAQISGLLSIIPPARSWPDGLGRFHGQKMVDLLRSVDMTKANLNLMGGPSTYGYGYAR